MRLGSFGLICLALSACATPEPLALQDPKQFIIRYDRGAMTTAYNPEGFTTETVEKLFERTCDKAKLTQYTESPDDIGLVHVVATCGVGADLGIGTVDIRKRSKSELVDAKYRTRSTTGRVLRKWTL
ncbi:MAG: hypothetical protein AAGF71_01560 [Pseudomonadota bacterium]